MLRWQSLWVRAACSRIAELSNHPCVRSEQLPVSQKTVAILSLVVSLGSIVFGIVAKAMQQVTVTIMNDAEAPLLGANQDRLDRGSGFSESVRDIVSRLREEGFRLTKSGRDDAAGGGRELSGAE